MKTTLSRAIGFFSPRANGARQPPSIPPSLPPIEVLRSMYSNLPETPTKGGRPLTDLERMLLTTVAKQKARNAKASSSRKTLDTIGNNDSDATMSGAENDDEPSYHSCPMPRNHPYKTQKGIAIADPPKTKSHLAPYLRSESTVPLMMNLTLRQTNLISLLQRNGRGTIRQLPLIPAMVRVTTRMLPEGSEDYRSHGRRVRLVSVPCLTSLIDFEISYRSSLPTPADTPKRKSKKGKKKDKGKQKEKQQSDVHSSDDMSRQRDTLTVETEHGAESFWQPERLSVETTSGGVEQGQPSDYPKQYTERRYTSIEQDENLRIAGDEDDALWSPSPQEHDPDEINWIKHIAEEIDPTDDDLAVLREFAHEPDQNKITLLAALRMRHDSCEIPSRTRRALTAEAHRVLLNSNWPTCFKNRTSNFFRLFERLRGNPRKIGLDENWISDPFKFRALRRQALLSFSEARRRIVDKVEISINTRLSVERLAQELGKVNPERLDLEITALLRYHCRAGRPALFDRVDGQLSELQKLPFHVAKRILDQILMRDKVAFPE